ncbi:MAG: hypothetical protein K0Q79_346 [Flavipsychrobacter sp.]|nr:hypothetical protein [Flavipsychrobacter sp.]
MAKAIKTNIKRNNTAQPLPAPASAPSKPLPHLLIISFIAIVTWLFLKTCLDNDIATWDDTPYIRENALVKDLSWEGIKHIFSTPSMGNYHPLTILSYAIEYSFVQLEPWLYHFDNLLLHVLCTVLVYWLVWLLSKNRIAAVITALLFGLHPMHVESVAWAAARKDVLYGAFYLGALVLYVYYLRATSKKGLLYAGVLLLFLFSLLSKPVAVTLPLTLLLIDYIEKRNWTKQVIIEKLPFFILSLAFGIAAIKSQHTAGAMAMQKIEYSALERIALGGYAFITYLWKAVVPAGLRCLYHYPEKVGGSISSVFYLYPVIAITLIALAWKFLRRNRILVFGLLFFIVNIALLLQFMQVGEAIVAERYSYIPYIGLFFIAGWYVSQYYETGKSNVRYAVLLLSVVCIGCMGFISSERCKVWADDISLWRDEIEKEPKLAVQAYNNLAYIYYTRWAQLPPGDEKAMYYDSSVQLFSKSMMLNPKFMNPYMGLGELQRNAGKYDEAKKIYYEGLRNNPSESNLYVGLAILYVVTHENDSAGKYFRETIRVKPSAEAYGNYGNYLDMNGKTDSALLMLSKAVSLTKENYVPYMNRGILLKKLNRWDEACADFERAITINPDAGEIYYVRSECDTQRHNYAGALQNVEQALSLGYRKVDDFYYNSLKQRAAK